MNSPQVPCSSGPVLQMTTGCGQQGLNWDVYFEVLPSPTRLKLAEPSRTKVKGLSPFWGQLLKPVAAKKHLYLPQVGMGVLGGWPLGSASRSLFP